MRKVEAIVLHWVANPGSTAEGNRRYFESLKDGSRKASAHYIIDSWEIVHAVPDNEVAYHCGQPAGQPYTPWAVAKWGAEHPNWYTLGIEHCHPDWSGIWERGVIQRSHVLAAGLCLRHGLDPTTDIVTHFTITGKECPRWFVVDPRQLAVYRDAVMGILEV